MKEYSTSTHSLIRIDDPETFAALTDSANLKLIAEGRRFQVYASTGRWYTTMYIYSQDPQFAILTTPNEHLDQIMEQLTPNGLPMLLLPLVFRGTREEYEFQTRPANILPFRHRHRDQSQTAH